MSFVDRLLTFYLYAQLLGCPSRTGSVMTRRPTLLPEVIHGLAAKIAISLDVATSKSFIDFGAFTAFTRRPGPG